MVHWEKSLENFGKMLYSSRNLPISFSKWANNSPILRKKWENLGKNTKISIKFPMSFPGVRAGSAENAAQCM